MSALGQKRTLTSVEPMSALPPIADIGAQQLDVRFVPKADQVQCSKKNRSYSRGRSWLALGLRQTRFEHGEKARCFTSGDGAMIEG